MIFEATSYRLSRRHAEQVIASVPNEFYVPGHKDLGRKIVPDAGDLSRFYPDPEDRQSAIIGRALGLQQGIVWATGTHTSTPVLVVASGPGEQHFGEFLTGDEMGKRLLRLMAR